MKMKGPWMGDENEYRYKYNGIEEIDDFGLDLSFATFRTLDPSIGRWLQVDPMSEYLYDLSPYNAMNNNPVTFNDPDGDIAPLLLAGIAVVGGLGNLAYNASKGNINSVGDGFKAFGIGAAAGVGAAYLAVPAATALAGGAGISLTGGFVTGAVVGGVGGGISEVFRNVGNAAVFQDVSLGEAFKNIGFGIASGAAIGGVLRIPPPYPILSKINPLSTFA